MTYFLPAAFIRERLQAIVEAGRRAERLLGPAAPVEARRELARAIRMAADIKSRLEALASDPVVFTGEGSTEALCDALNELWARHGRDLRSRALAR